VDSFSTSNFDEEFSRNGNDDAENLDVGLWIGRILSWDGLLPAIVFAASVGVAVLFPNNRIVPEIAMVVLPIGAFLWRARAGHRQINTNGCGPWTRAGQYVALGFALLLFLFFDFMLVLLEFIPKGQRGLAQEDVPIWVGMVIAYLVLATFAMYPGRGLNSATIHSARVA
jgi:hypothetical protein